MKTTRPQQRLILTLVTAATIMGVSACGTAGTGTGLSAAPPAVAGSAGASMDPGMNMSASHSAMPSSMSATSSASNGTAAETTIHIKSFAYTGADSVKAGSTVTVMNMDNVAHTVTADDGSFDAVIKAGTSTTFTAPTKPGTYTYHCTYHSNMHGTLSVR